MATSGQAAGVDARDLGSYCRELESYLCRKNGGHLIRIVGPSFELVSGWHARGVPLRVVQQGIDRAVARRPRAGARRPLRIEFCEPDVLEAFDEWRRAMGPFHLSLAGEDAASAVEPPPHRASARQPSLPAHLRRVLVRLSSLRAMALHAPSFEAALDAAIRDLDAMHDASRTARGAARTDMVAHLGEIDRRLVAAARDALSLSDRDAILRQAEEQLAPHRPRMSPEDYTRLRDTAVARLVRARLGLPQVEL